MKLQIPCQQSWISTGCNLLSSLAKPLAASSQGASATGRRISIKPPDWKPGLIVILTALTRGHCRLVNITSATVLLNPRLKVASRQRLHAVGPIFSPASSWDLEHLHTWPLWPEPSPAHYDTSLPSPEIASFNIKMPGVDSFSHHPVSLCIPSLLPPQEL